MSTWSFANWTITLAFPSVKLTYIAERPTNKCLGLAMNSIQSLILMTNVDKIIVSSAGASTRREGAAKRAGSVEAADQEGRNSRHKF